MRHRLRQFLSASAILLWIAVLVAWPQSYYGGQTFCAVKSQIFYLTSVKGQVHVLWQFGDPNGATTSQRWHFLHWTPPQSGPTGGSGPGLTIVQEMKLTDFMFCGNPLNTWSRAPFPGVHEYYGSAIGVVHPRPSPDFGDTGRPFAFLRLPYWFVATVATIGTGIAVYRISSQRRATRLGYCRHCHYDLRASTDRCPECGNAIPIAASPPNLGNGPRAWMLNSLRRVDLRLRQRATLILINTLLLVVILVEIVPPTHRDTLSATIIPESNDALGSKLVKTSYDVTDLVQPTAELSSTQTGNERCRDLANMMVELDLNRSARSRDAEPPPGMIDGYTIHISATPGRQQPIAALLHALGE